MNRIVKILLALVSIAALTEAQPGYCGYAGLFSTLIGEIQHGPDAVSENLDAVVAALEIQETDIVKSSVVSNLRLILQVARDINPHLHSFLNLQMGSLKTCTADFFLVYYQLKEALEVLLRVVEDWIEILPTLATSSEWEEVDAEFHSYVQEYVLRLGSAINALTLSLASYLLRDTSSQYPTYSSTWPMEIQTFRDTVSNLRTSAPARG